jgi:hypothetical protein
VRAGRNPERPLAEFPRNRATADGLALYCRQCKRDADRERTRGPQVPAPAMAQAPAAHPATAPVGVPQNSEPPRARAPALAITEELISRASDIIREIGATRRAAARHVGVSENTFKSWLREAADLKDDDDPRRRLLFAVELAEGDAEMALTRAYFAGAQADPQVAQRFLERRFSKGDEKWARTEHLSVTDGDAAPMEMTDARKLLADKLDKLLGARAAGRATREGTGVSEQPAPGEPAPGPDAAGARAPAEGPA